MAFLMLRNVKAIITPLCRYRSSFQPNSLKYALVGAKRIPNIVYNTPSGAIRCISYLPGALNCAAPSAISHQQESLSESVIESTSSSDSHVELESADPHRVVRLNRFKRKPAFLKHFNERISSGEVLSTNQAFGLLKSCGPRMVGETDASRNELVTHVWQALEENGVPLQTGLWNTLLSVYVENRHDFEPLEFLKRLWEKSDAEPNKTTFSLLIQAYAVKGDPAGAMKIVEFMMKNDEARMTEHIYAWLIQAFAKKGDMEGVEEILKSMKESGVKPRHSTFGHLIDAHAERGDMENINKTIEEMIERRLYPTSETYINLLDHLSLGGHNTMIPQVWERIESIEYLNEDVKPLIQKCITRGHYESALQLLLCSTKMLSNRKESFDRYIEKRILNNVRFCEKETSEYLKVTSLMETHLSQAPASRLYYLVDFLLSKNEPEVALEVLEKVITDDGLVRVQLFHPILKYYAEKKNIHGITDVYKFMLDNEITIDYYCYRNIQPALGEPGSEEHNLFLSLMKGVKNFELPYSAVSKIFENENVGLSQIGEIVDNASSAGLFASLKPLKKALLEDFNAVDASKIIIALHRKGMNDITVLIDELMGSLVNQETKKANEALEFLKTLMENDIPISSHSYTKMLKALHWSGMSDQFFTFVRLMKENGVDPDVHQYYQMLKMAATVGNSMAAQFCFDKVQDSDAFPDRKHELYEYLITAYGRDTENAKIIPAYIQGRESEHAQKVIQLFEEMVEKEYRPSANIITLIIRNYLLNLDIDGAKKIIEEYGEGKEQLLRTVKNSFMRAYVAKKDFQAAEEFFEEMKKEQLLTALQYNEMMRMCEATGNTAKVEALFKEMVDSGFEPNVFTYLHRIRTFIANKQPQPCIEILLENIASGKNLLRVDIFMIVLRHLVPTGNIEDVVKVIELIKTHHYTKVPPKRLDHALSLVHIKAGNIEEASKLLPTVSEDSDEPVEIELNPYRKVAKTASMEGDVEYIENIMTFLKVNELHYQSLDTFYLLALNKTDNTDGIRRLYEERLADGFAPTEKFMSLLQSIVEDKGIKDINIPDTNKNDNYLE